MKNTLVKRLRIYRQMMEDMGDISVETLVSLNFLRDGFPVHDGRFVPYIVGPVQIGGNGNEMGSSAEVENA